MVDRISAGQDRARMIMLMLAALVVGFTAVPAAAADSPPPNVILIMTDDQGYGDLAAHGNTVLRTPNLDRLHSQSVRLTDFHVDPTCSPTRAALMTGRYSTRTGVWHTIAGRSLMAHDEITLAEIFSRNGYRTAIFGKWHLGDNFPMRPRDRGFHQDLIHGGGGIGQTPDHWSNDYFDDTYFRNGQPESFTGYCTDIWFDESLRFIEENKDHPFFLYLPTNAAHSPFHVADEYSDPYREEGVPDRMADFYGMIENIDDNMGRLLARLDELNLEENTILIFMTDNGTAAGVARPADQVGEDGWRGFNAGMRGTKGSEYDGGHRVPCFIRYPAGDLIGGRDIPQLTAHIDLAPTLIELCDLDRPDGLPFDGRSIVPLLHGETADWPDRTLFVHSQRIEHPEKWRKSAVMSDRWRLVNGRQLFDIRADPDQSDDLADDHPDVVQTLRKAYDAWWRDLSEAFDEYVPIVVGSEEENPARLTCHDWHAPLQDVPWNQRQVRAMPHANGFWIIDAAHPGEYEFTLRHRPPEADDFPLQAATARLKVGDQDLKQSIPDGTDAVTFSVHLDAGQQRLQTWLTTPDNNARGAFFLQVDRTD